MVEGVGPWRNFDEIEEYLTLDELLLLHNAWGRSKHNDFRFHASLQGVELGESPYDDEGIDQGSDGLPPELLEKEREWKKRKQEYLESKAAQEGVPTDIVEMNEAGMGGFGYSKA